MKVSVATTVKPSKGGRFALHAMDLPGSPYDGHTLATVISDMEETIGNEIERMLADAGYRGHNAPQSHKSGSSFAFPRCCFLGTRIGWLETVLRSDCSSFRHNLSSRGSSPVSSEFEGWVALG